MARTSDLTNLATVPTGYMEWDNGSEAVTRKMSAAGFNALVVSKAAAGGIVSAGTSWAARTENNDWLAAGTADRCGGFKFQTADWTPAADKPLWTKFASNLGTKVWLLTSGKLRLEYGNGTNFSTYRFDSTLATGVPDGAEARIDWTEDRDGNLVWYVDGAQLGDPISIAAAAAQTLTNTGPLLWLSDGTTHTAGKLSDAYKVKGLLSASRIADIYRAGSIAPFCVMTPNATTGQNTATIDGLNFFQLLELERADPTNNPIVPDRSGNNQVAVLGTSGLFPAVRRNWVNKAPTRGALVSDGSSNSFARATLNTQNPGLGDVVLWWEGVYPQDATSTAKVLTALTSSTSDINQPRLLWVGYSSTTGLFVSLKGATTADDRSKTSLSLHSSLAALGSRGIATTIVVVRNSTGLRIFLGIGRDAQRFSDVTNLFSEVTTGTPPAWTDEIDGDYFIGAYRNSTTSSAHTLYDLRLANVAMTEAQLRAEYERGEPRPEQIGASRNLWSRYNYSFEADTNSPPANWLQDGNHTLTAVADVTAPAGSNVGEIVASGAGVWTGNAVYNTNSAARRIGSSYRVKFSAKSISGNTALSLNGNFTESFTLTGSWVEYTSSVFVPTTTGTLTCSFLLGGAGTARIDNVRFVGDGWTTRLRTDAGGGFQARNDAKSATNDSTDFELSTTGITWSPEAQIGARAPVRATFLHSAISTSDGTTAFFSLPANWAIVDFQVNPDVAFDTGVTVSVGTSASPTRWVNALAVDSTGLKQATSLQLFPQSLTATTSVYIKKSGSTTTGNLLVCTAIIERKY